jgi:hypothetical protein
MAAMKRVLIVTSLLFLSIQVMAGPSVIVDKEDKVDGKPLDEYAGIWWQWAYSMPDRDSPIIDKTGEKCDVNQEGPVWFLAGGYGSSKIKRSCVVPSDKYIFFPVINMVHYSKVPGAMTCRQAQKSAAMNNNYLTSFVVTVDGEKIVNPAFHRYQSPDCFDLLGMVPKELHAPRVYPAAADGYWVMLRPLPSGLHKIAFHAEYNNPGKSYGRMVQDIEYSIDVVAP